jgi:phosphatidyl-myo-inositol dimannoside synthase
MRVVAVQTGLSPLSVLGGTITDREFLTRLADRGVEVHVLVEAGEPIVEHHNLIPHTWRRRLRKRLPYMGNADVAIDLPALLRRVGTVDWIRFNSPAALGIGALVGSRGQRLWASYTHCEDVAFRRFVDSWLPARCDLITCLSEDTRRDVVTRCPASDHSGNIVVPLGIDVARVESAGRPRAEVRKELGLAASELLVLFVGVLTPRKGISELVAAWRKLGSRTDLRLLLISRPISEYETRLVEELVRKDSRVRHLSRVPYERIAEYFRAADIFFFPTRLEGFGIVVGEAMAAGLPVVTTRAKGVRGVVSEGETAICTDVGDVDEMTRSLEKLAGNPGLRRDLGEKGRRRAMEHFSWERRIDTLLEALDSPSRGQAASAARSLRRPAPRSPRGQRDFGK